MKFLVGAVLGAVVLLGLQSNLLNPLSCPASQNVNIAK